MTRPANKHTLLQTRVIVGSLSLSVTAMTLIFLAWPQNLACQHSLDAPWRHLGLPSRHLGSPWCHLGASLAHFGIILTPYWDLLVAILKKSCLSHVGFFQDGTLGTLVKPLRSLLSATRPSDAMAMRAAWHDLGDRGML